MKETEKGKIRDALLFYKDGKMTTEEMITLIGDIYERARDNKGGDKPNQTTAGATCNSYDAQPYGQGCVDKDTESIKEERMNISEPFLEED